MKKLFYIISLFILFSSCDDGDIALESFDFDDSTIQKCSELTYLYKINDAELLLLNFPESSYVNEVTPPNEPRIININSSNSILYRIYSGTITNAFICASITPAQPVVTNEWQAQGGTAEVITTEKRDTNDVLIGYNHSITLKNVNFSGTNNNFSFTEYFFGTYQTSL